MSWHEKIADMARKINLYVPICPTEGDSVSLYRESTKLEKLRCRIVELLEPYRVERIFLPHPDPDE